jgi:hypothetical protein
VYSVSWERDAGGGLVPTQALHHSLHMWTTPQSLDILLSMHQRMTIWGIMTMTWRVTQKEKKMHKILDLHIG